MKLFVLLAVLVGSAVANEWINKIEPAAYQGSPNFDPRDTAALIENLFKSVGVGNVGISGQNLGSSTKQQLTAEMFNQLVDVIIKGVEAGLNATAGGSPGGAGGGLGGLLGGGGGGAGGVDMGALMGLLQGGKDGGVDMNALSSLLGNAGGTDGSTEDKASTDDGNTDTESDASTDDQMADLMNLLNEVDESDGESDTKRAVTGRKRRDNAIKETINRLVNQFKGFAERFEMVVKKNIVKAKFALVEFGQQLEDAIDEVLKLSPDILKNGSKKVNELLSEIAGRSQVAVDKAVTKLQEEVQRISNSDLAKKTKEFFVPRIHAVIETLKSLGASANNSAKDLSKKIKDALANAGENAGLTQEKLKELFKDKLENLKDIKNAIKQIVDENISTLDDPKQY